MDNSQTSDEILGFTRYQWLVLFAAWLGWGFDVFDALLFNFVARLCIPSLLGEAQVSQQTLTQWTGILTSVLLIGWALGGVIFGKITDRFGRTRTLLITMLTYALATAACSMATSIWMLMIFRFIASLGIGGEWAAGASLVSETVPQKKRVQAGALLYTAAPAGLFLANFITDLFTRRLSYFAQDPELSWRAVFLSGLLPAAVAIVIRLRVKEPEVWKPSVEAPRLAELFTPEFRRQTFGGLAMASTALIGWWSCNAFIPLIASFLVTDIRPVPSPAELAVLKGVFAKTGSNWFNFGGLLGTLLTVPVALRFGRRPMFFVYFVASAASIWLTFRAPMAPEARLISMFFIGLSVFGVFGSFTFYLPELFPCRLRGTGSGFCYNTGRFITALGPALVAYVASRTTSSAEILEIVSWVAIVPCVGLVFLLCGLGEETKGRALD